MKHYPMVSRALGPVRLVLTRARRAQFTPDGRWLLLERGRQCELYDVENLTCWRSFAGSYVEGGLSADGRHLLVGDGPALVVLRTDSGLPVNDLRRRSLFDNRVPGGARRISVQARFYRGRLLLAARPRYKWSDGDDRYERMAQDRTHVCAVYQAFEDHLLKRWQTSSRGFSPDGRFWLMAGRGGRSYHVRDLEKEEVVYSSSRHLGGTAFTGDSRLLALRQRVPGGRVAHYRTTVLDLVDDRKVGESGGGSLYSLQSTFWLWRVREKRFVDALSGESIDVGNLGQGVPDPSGRLVARMEPGRLQLRLLDSGETVCYEDDELPARAPLMFSPDGATLLVLGAGSSCEAN